MKVYLYDADTYRHYIALVVWIVFVLFARWLLFWGVGAVTAAAKAITALTDSLVPE